MFFLNRSRRLSSRLLYYRGAMMISNAFLVTEHKAEEQTVDDLTFYYFLESITLFSLANIGPERDATLS